MDNADGGLLELHPNDPEYVHEDPSQWRLATAFLRARRGDYIIYLTLGYKVLINELSINL